MPDPHDTLAVFAEVSVALAGFSGIAIAVGRRSLGAVTPLDARRLSNLFALSGAVLGVSLLGIAMLHVAGVNLSTLAAVGSGLIILLASPWLLIDAVRVRRLSRAERAEVHPLVFYPFNAAAVLGLVLQGVNIAFIRAAWPVFIALLVATIIAFQQFILLVRSGFSASRSEPTVLDKFER